MIDTDFIQKCFQKWKEENPNGTQHEFYILCRMWQHIHESTYGMEIKSAKTPKDMYDEGWCKDCSADYSECVKLNKCKGDKR